jgi:hypothetical protein
MNNSLQEAIKEAYATAASNVAVLETIEIAHPSLPSGSIFLVQNREDITFTLEDTSTQLFQAAGFSITPPSMGDTGLQELSLSIDNVDRQVSDFIDLVKESSDPVTVIYRPYLSNDPTTPQMVPPLTLFLTDVTIDLFKVSAKATFFDIINKKAPSEIYTRFRFPSLGG